MTTSGELEETIRRGDIDRIKKALQSATEALRDTSYTHTVLQAALSTRKPEILQRVMEAAGSGVDPTNFRMVINRIAGQFDGTIGVEISQGAVFIYIAEIAALENFKDFIQSDEFVHTIDDLVNQDPTDVANNAVSTLAALLGSVREMNERAVTISYSNLDLANLVKYGYPKEAVEVLLEYAAQDQCQKVLAVAASDSAHGEKSWLEVLDRDDARFADIEAKLTMVENRIRILESHPTALGEGVRDMHLDRVSSVDRAVG